MNVETFVPPAEIDLHRQLKVLIHGWNADRHHISITPIRTAYLVQDAHNLVVVDWSPVATLLYPTARELVLPVGNRIGSIVAHFVGRLGIDNKQVHVIGHSLGAHIAGVVGRFFGGKLARVTALDPAGPLFEQDSMDAVGPDAAHFVDVIHTDGLTLGENVVRGHADFFPNSGLPPQPGCETLDVITLRKVSARIRYSVTSRGITIRFAFGPFTDSCSHARSTGFFAESIALPSNFVACACSREEIARQDDICLPDVRESSMRECVLMGESLPSSARGTFYIRTSRVPPFGLGYHAKSGPAF
uniref:Lipase domain-containing protein n=1 Tax=Anopheles dirus TaxID=7168 RepID=A0A182N1V2_9DIPT